MDVTSANDLEQIELSIDNAKKLIEFKDALERLEKDPDWIKIMEEDFFKNNIIRLVKLKASPSCQDEMNQKFVTQQIDAVGQFSQYLLGIRIQGNSAKVAMERDAEERERILAEED